MHMGGAAENLEWAKLRCFVEKQLYLATHYLEGKTEANPDGIPPDMISGPLTCWCHM